VNLQLFLSALRARLGVFALVLAATILAATVVSLVLPKTYKATVSLVVDAKEEQSLSNVLRPLMQPLERIGYLQTQVDILTSEKVARQVVRDLKLAENPTALAAYEQAAVGVGSIEDWLAENLLRYLKVETSQSSVIYMNFSSKDARFSARVANAFAKAYLDTTLELRVEPTRQAAAWFDEQLKSLRANLEQAQARLTDYHRNKGIVSADERNDIESVRLGELSVQVAKAQERTLEWETRLRQARAFLAAGAEPLDKVPEVLANPFIQRLKEDVLHGEAKLQELATQYGPNYPGYQRLLSENRSLRERLNAEMHKVVEGIENSARQSRQSESGLRNALAAQRAQVLESKEDRNELTVLVRDVGSAQAAYDTAMQRYVVSQVESRASQANVTVLNPAAVPLKPSFPKPVLNIALSVVLGTMLGIGIVILAELLDRRVRSADDLAYGLDVPLLTVLNARQSGTPYLGDSHAARRALPAPGPG
jgi:chain length determinant protein EpsF